MVLLQDSILVVACGYSRNTYFFLSVPVFYHRIIYRYQFGCVWIKLRVRQHTVTAIFYRGIKNCSLPSLYIGENHGIVLEYSLIHVLYSQVSSQSSHAIVVGMTNMR